MEIKSCKNVCEEGMKETNLTVPVLRISINIYWKTLRIGTERTRTTPSQNQHRDDLTSAQYSLFPLHSTKHMKQISTHETNLHTLYRESLEHSNMGLKTVWKVQVTWRFVSCVSCCAKKTKKIVLKLNFCAGFETVLSLSSLFLVSRFLNTDVHQLACVFTLILLILSDKCPQLTFPKLGNSDLMLSTYPLQSAANIHHIVAAARTPAGMTGISTSLQWKGKDFLGRGSQ